jgi:hypothetical protein
MVTLASTTLAHRDDLLRSLTVTRWHAQADIDPRQHGGIWLTPSGGQFRAARPA